jgi:hypothetical protein
VINRSKGRSARFAAAGALAVGVLTAFAAVAGVGFTQSAAGAGQYQYGKQKVTLCHLTHSKKHPAVTITVGAPAVKAHLKHGDHLGACTGAEIAAGKQKNKPNHPNHPSHPSKPSHPSTPSTGNTPSNGNGNGNGNNGSNGKGHGKK